MKEEEPRLPNFIKPFNASGRILPFFICVLQSFQIHIFNRIVGLVEEFLQRLLNGRIREHRIIRNKLFENKVTIFCDEAAMVRKEA